MKSSKWIWILFLVLFFLNFSPVRAQTSQNVIFSCLDATMLDPANQTINGTYYHHLLSLTNRDQKVFIPGKPVYIIRSLVRVFCNPNDNDPECIKDSQNRTSPCIQEKVGANICNQNCPWGNHVCIKDNVATDHTVCCMDLYTKQGPYFECAKDKNGQLLCPDSIMAEFGQTNGIHPTEDGHIETGYESSVILVNDNKDSVVADSNGNIHISAVQDYSRVSLDRGYYGLQVLSDQAITNNEALQNSLKLALFTQFEVTEPSAINCTTVFWDPYGKVVDALRLEPIYNLPILLKSLDSNGGVIETTITNNPAFKNPELTDFAGNFNFAVPSGTYFLEPLTGDFVFPINDNDLSRTLNNLRSLDPEQEYIKRDKVYNSLTEPIIEHEGRSERRDLILLPKDENYQGTAPVIISAENLRHEDNQLIRGRASHPKSLVKVYLGGGLVGQTEADMKGSFSLIIPQTLINNNSGEFTIYAEKVPLYQTVKNNPLQNRILSLFVKRVLAQQSTISSPYSLSLVPIRLTGFVFDSSVQVQPNSIVQLIVPSLGEINYSQTISDKNGYINIDPKNLPPFNFVLNVTGTDKKKDYQLTIDDFNKTNSVFFAETGVDLYNTKVALTKPSLEIVKKVHAQTPKTVSPSTLSLNKQPTPTLNQNQTVNNLEQTNTNNNRVFVIVFVFMLLTVGTIGFIIVKRNKNKNQIYY